MKRTFTIGKKLTMVVGGLVAVVLALSVFSLTAINKQEASFINAADKTFRRTILAHKMNTAEANLLAAQRGYIVYTMLKKPSGVEDSRRMFQSTAESLKKTLAEFRPLIATEEGRQLEAKIESNFAAWEEVFGEISSLCDRGDPAGSATVGIEKGLPLYRAIGQEAGRLQEIQNEMIQKDRASAVELAGHGRWIVSLLIVVCLAVGIASGFVVRQIDRVLRVMVTELGEGANQVASAANQISSSSQSLSQGASEQAATLEETSASSEEISSMIQKNAGTSRDVAQNTLDAAKYIEVANQSLEQMVGSMKEINASSDKIAKIIKVIDEIAFQTNLLALNAAVEAARAGEAGMGFAVVAEEVRSLAQRCAQAAKDTEGLIEESIQKSRDGKTKLELVTAAIVSVTDSASKVRVLADELDLASQEQAKGMQQVALAIVTMEQVTQKTAASAEESASAGEELSAQSETLREMVGRLGQLVGSDA